MDDESRHTNRRQDVANVDVGVHPGECYRGAGTCAHAQIRRPPLAKRRIGHARWRAFVNANRTAPIIDDRPAERVAIRTRRSPRIVSVLQPAGVAADHHECLGAVRIRRREKAAQRSAFRDPHQHRSLGARRFHHGAHVVQALLQRRQLADGHGIRQTGTALVKKDETSVRRKVSQKPGERRFVPEVLEVRHPAHHEHDVAGARTDHLIRDVHGTAVRVLDDGHRNLRDGRRTAGRRRAAIVSARRGNTRDEAIAAPVSGFDITRRVRIVTKRTPQITDGGFQHRFAHVHAWPQPVEQLLLGNQAPGLGGHVLEQREGFRRQRHSLVATVELAAQRHRGGIRQTTQGRRMSRPYRILTIFSPSSYGVCNAAAST